MFRASVEGRGQFGREGWGGRRNLPALRGMADESLAVSCECESGSSRAL